MVLIVLQIPSKINQDQSTRSFTCAINHKMHDMDSTPGPIIHHKMKDNIPIYKQFKTAQGE